MRTFNFFVVELKKLVNDTITTESGLELYIDSKHDDMGEFNYRVTEGPVVASTSSMTLSQAWRYIILPPPRRHAGRSSTHWC